MQVFEERGKPEYPGKNLSEQRGEPTNSTHIWHRIWKSNPGHIGGRRVLSPLRHHCSLWIIGKWSQKREVTFLSRSRRRRLCLSSLLTKKDLRTGLRVFSKLIYFNKERQIHAHGRGSRKTWRDARVFGARASLASRVVWVSRVSGHFARFFVCLAEIKKYSPTKTSQSRNIEFYQAWVLNNPSHIR